MDCDTPCDISKRCICEDDIRDDTLKCLECEDGYNLTEAKCIGSDISTISDNNEILINKGFQVMQLLTIVSVSFSIASMNINSIFSMIGTIQIISYILLYNINIPSKARDILEGLNIFVLLPNIFEYFIPNHQTIRIDRYNRVDIYNELFLINSGKILTTLIIFICLILIMKILYCIIRNIRENHLLKKVIEKVLETYEWNLVIGYILQGSLELTIFSLINIYHVSFNDTNSIIGFSFSIFTLVIYT